MKKSNKNTWFKKVRGSYLPSNWQGWLTYLPFIFYLLVVLQTSIRESDNVSHAIYIIFPQFVAAAVVMTWIAKQKS